MLGSPPAGEIEQTLCAVITVVHLSVTVTVPGSVSANQTHLQSRQVNALLILT